MKNKLKNVKGITLIALVITIIVLLILAGVTVATLTGENGLLSKTQIAKERNEEAEQDEKDKLSSYEDEIDNYATWERTGENENIVTTSSFFIDTSTLLANISNVQSWTSTASSVNTSYTATQDCAVCGWVASCPKTSDGGSTPSNSQGINLKVNNVSVQRCYYSGNSGSVMFPITIYVKKGDIFSISLDSELYKGYLNVYGLR